MGRAQGLIGFVQNSGTCQSSPESVADFSIPDSVTHHHTDPTRPPRPAPPRPAPPRPDRYRFPDHRPTPFALRHQAPMSLSLRLRLILLLCACGSLTSCGTATHLLGQAGGLVNSVTSPVLGAIRLSDSPDSPSSPARPAPTSPTQSAHDAQGVEAQRAN